MTKEELDQIGNDPIVQNAVAHRLADYMESGMSLEEAEEAYLESLKAMVESAIVKMNDYNKAQTKDRK